MKRFDRLILWTISIGIAVIALFAAYGFRLAGDLGDKTYRIEVNRITREISDGREPDELKLEEYTHVRNAAWLEWNAEPEAVRRFLTVQVCRTMLSIRLSLFSMGRSLRVI